MKIYLVYDFYTGLGSSEDFNQMYFISKAEAHKETDKRKKEYSIRKYPPQVGFDWITTED